MEFLKEQEVYYTINWNNILWGSSWQSDAKSYNNLRELAEDYYPELKNAVWYKFVSENGRAETWVQHPKMKEGFVMEFENKVCIKIEKRKNYKRTGIAFYSMKNDNGKVVWTKAEFDEESDSKLGYYMEFEKNGDVLKIEHFKKDHKDGYNCWFKDDCFEEGYYDDDLRCGAFKVYYRTGKIKLDNVYYPTGAIKLDNVYEVKNKSQILVKSIEYYPSGCIRQEGGYENGYRQGIHVWYYDGEGKRKEKQIFYNQGIPYSGAMKWDKEGKLIKHSIFNGGIEKQIVINENQNDTKIQNNSFYVDLPLEDPDARESKDSVGQDILQIVTDNSVREMVCEDVGSATEEDEILQKEGEEIEVYPLEGGDNVNMTLEERKGKPLEYGIKINQEKRNEMNAYLLKKFKKDFVFDEEKRVWTDHNHRIRMKITQDTTNNDFKYDYYCCEGFYSNGRPLFHCTVFNPSHDFTQDNCFILHGYYTQFYLNGLIRYTGLFVDGKRENVHRFYYESGAIQYSVTYHNDKLTRESLGYRENGSLSFFVSYIADTLEFKYATYEEEEVDNKMVSREKEVVRILAGEKHGVHLQYQKENDRCTQDDKPQYSKRLRVEYYDHDLLEGTATEFYEDCYSNKRMRTKNHDLLEGTATENCYSNKWIRTKIETYHKGKKHGLSILFKNGIPLEQNLFKEGNVIYKHKEPITIINPK